MVGEKSLEERSQPWFEPMEFAGTKFCPLCQTAQIENWECLCFSCWKKVQIHDRMYGTEYIKAFMEGKKPSDIPNITLAQIAHWLKGRAHEMLVDISKEICKYCPRQVECGENHDLTEKCKFHRYLNFIKEML